ncbi:MAG: hypothetical protein VKN56_01880 [Cyanobacteriota bacterium]|nr:hypothetical protein [Cyanobacteriota bacterium]
MELTKIHLLELVLRLFKEKGANTNVRLNRNNLVFVCADALQQMPQSFALAVQECYRHVFYPERGQ